MPRAFTTMKAQPEPNHLNNSFNAAGLFASSNTLKTEEEQEDEGPKEPKEYTFQPCLSKCCDKFDHMKSVMVLGVLGGFLSLVALNVCIYLLISFEELNLRRISKGELILCSGVLAVSVGIHVLLFFAVRLWKRSLLLPWICFTFPLIFVLFGVFFYFLYILVFGKDAEDDDDPTTDYVMLAIGLVGGSADIYLWSLVWSLYIRMGTGCYKEHQLRPPPWIAKSFNSADQHKVQEDGAENKAFDDNDADSVEVARDPTRDSSAGTSISKKMEEDNMARLRRQPDDQPPPGGLESGAGLPKLDFEILHCFDATNGIVLHREDSESESESEEHFQVPAEIPAGIPGSNRPAGDSPTEWMSGISGRTHIVEIQSLQRRMGPAEPRQNSFD